VERPRAEVERRGKHRSASLGVFARSEGNEPVPLERKSERHVRRTIMHSVRSAMTKAQIASGRIVEPQWAS